MGQTISEKIISKVAGLKEVKPGDVVTCSVDLAMIHDSGGPRRVKQIMEKLGAKRQNIVAALGPCIRQSSYEVGNDFKQIFLDVDTENGTYFEPASRLGHAMFDLAGFVVGRMQRFGIGTIEDIAIDTYPEQEGFFSYRRTIHRGEQDYGRGLSAVMLEGR